MLVLSRKYGERIYVGPDITITVVQIRGNQVRIGVNAPRDVLIHCGQVDADGRSGPDYKGRREK